MDHAHQHGSTSPDMTQKNYLMLALNLLAGAVIYQLLLPLGACWAWFGC